MYHHQYSPLTSSRITDYSTDFGHELSFLAPTATRQSSKKQHEAEESALLTSVDTGYHPAYNPVYTQDSTRAWSGIRPPRRRRFGRYFQLHDPDDPISRFQGWRRAVIAAAAITGLVLIINSVFMIVVLAKYKTVGGVGDIYTGDCDLVKRWNTGLHLTINVLGTFVLAASSFTMQCLCSPTRSEVNVAHSKRRSLEIGLVSFRNLFHVKRWKAISWLLLCFSTMPLHLLWNSTIFSTTSTNYFSYVVAEESFLTGASYQMPNQSYVNPCRGSNSIQLGSVIDKIAQGFNDGSYASLSAAECLNDYTAQLLNRQRNLIIIVQPPKASDIMSFCGYNGRRWNGSSVLGMDTNLVPSTGWLNRTWTQTKSLDSLRHDAATTGTWTLGNFTVTSCHSEQDNTALCKLQFVSYTLYVVVACNIIKFVTMCTTARFLWNLDEPILATVGDAVCSFLDHPDDTTAGLCLIDHHDVGKGIWRQSGANNNVYNSIYRRKPFRRLYFATSHARWWWTMTPLTLYLITGFVLWKVSLDNLSDYSFSESMKMKFGAVDEGLRFGLEGDEGSGLITNIVVANSFQVVLSATYFLYNSLYTAQCAALEWASFVGGVRKTLRVTWPRGEQRSTYYLQLSYRYGIPLTTLLLLMHFLISQSVFLARLQYRDWEGNLTPYGFADVGFSPRATLTTCLVGVAMILAQIVHSFRPLDNRIPIHGNRSAVISAMCHQPSREPDPWRSGNYAPQQAQPESISGRPLIWGVTKQPSEYGTGNSTHKGSGHCSFSTDEVPLPEIGKDYR